MERVEWRCSGGHIFWAPANKKMSRCPYRIISKDKPCPGTVSLYKPEPAYEHCSGTGEPEVPSTNRRSKKPMCPVCGKRVAPTLNHKVRAHAPKAA